MATKSRSLKTPLQLWIADNRKVLGLTPRDLAQLTGVTVDTARGWESRGRPSEDAIAILERKFGQPAPDRAVPSVDQSELAAAIRHQGDAILRLADAVRALVAGQEGRAAEFEASTQKLRDELFDRLGAIAATVGVPETPPADDESADTTASTQTEPAVPDPPPARHRTQTKRAAGRARPSWEDAEAELESRAM